MNLGVRDKPDPHGETPSLLKIQKLVGCTCTPAWATRVKRRFKKKKNVEYEARRGSSRLQSQHFGRPRWADRLRLGVLDQPDQHGETPSLLKMQN